MAIRSYPTIVRYGFAVIAVAIAIVLSLLMRPLIAPTPSILLFASVVATAWLAGMGPALLSAALAALVVEYYFVAPFEVFGLTPESLVRTALMFLVATGAALSGNVRRRAESSSYRSAELLKVTLASIGDAVLATDVSGAVTFINGVAEQLTGWSAKDAVGRPLADVFRIVNEESRAPVASPFELVIASGDIVGLANHTLLLARDGREIPVEDSGAPIRDVDGTIVGVVLVFRDGTERRRTEREREELLDAERSARAETELAQQRFEYLALASSVLSSSIDYETTIASAVRMAVPRLADWSAIDMLVDGEIRRLAVAHIDPAKVEWAHELHRRFPPVPDAPSGVPAVIRTGLSEFVPYITQEMIDAAVGDNQELREVIERIRFTSSMVVPIRVRDTVAGAITFVTAESGRHLDESDLALAEDLARRASAAIEHARLYREAGLQRRSLEITLSSIGDGVISTDGAGRIVFVNGVAERLTGWSAADAAGRHLDEVFRVTSELSNDPVASPVARVLAEGRVVEIGNGTLLIDRDGIARPIDDSAAPILDDGGAIVGVVMIFRDASERRRTEAEIRRHRDQLDAILRGVTDGITAQDHAGRLIFANDAAAVATGFASADALIAAGPTEILARFTLYDENGAPFPFSDLPGRHALAGEEAPHRTLQFVINATGERRWSTVYATPVRDASGAVQFAINIFHDITSAKLSEQALRERAEHQTAIATLGQRALAESDIAAVFDDAVRTVAATLDVELAKVLLIEEGSETMLVSAGIGFDPGVVGSTRVECGPNTQAGYTLGRRRPVIVDDLAHDQRFEGAPILHEHHVVSGMTVTIGTDTRPFGILGVHTRSYRPFSEDDAHFLESAANVIASSINRSRAEELLAHQREWLRVTLSSIGDAVIATDVDGRITFMNPVAARLTGWPIDEVEGRPLDEVFRIVNETTREVAPNPAREALASGVIVGLANHTVVIARDGTEVPIDDSAAPIRNVDGSVHGVVLVFHDVSERRRAEAALRLSESRFRLMVEQSPLSIQIFSPDGYCVQANRAWEELWQTPRSALEGYNVLEDAQLAASGVLDEIRHGFAGEARSLPPVKYDPAEIGRSGRPRWVRSVVYPVVDLSGEVREVALVLEDVTERVVAEQRLQIQFTVSRILSAAPGIAEAAADVLEVVGDHLGFSFGALWVIDRERDVLRFTDAWSSDPGGAEGLVAASRSLLLRRGEGVPGRVWQRSAPVDVADLATAAELPRAGALVGERLRTAFGFPIVLGGEVFGVFEFYSSTLIESRAETIDTVAAIGSQIGQFMERRRAEEALRESEERYRTVAETASDAILIVDESSRILFANRAVESVFGYDRDELLGSDLMRLMPDYLREAHARAVERYIRTGERRIDWSGVELPGLHRDGRTIPLEISFGEFIKDGQHLFTGIVRDITERKLAESELKLAKEQAEAANAAKDQFLAVLSHELRTPLTPVLTLVQFLETANEPPEDVRPIFTMIRRNIELEARLIDDLLDLTRITRGKLHLDVELVDAHGLIGNVVDICREEAEAKDQHIELELAATAHTVRADPARLQQVFWNLIQNAVKFTPAGGRISVSSRNPERDIIELEVRDTGIGLEGEQLARVFNAFEQAEQSISRRFGGLGLGLSISKSIVDMHGGMITAQSEGIDQGAAFTVRIATASPDDGPVSAGSPAGATNGQASARRILLVDDHADTSNVMKLLLERRGYTVETAADVAGALELATSREYDLLISDIGLPDGSGLELMQRIRERKDLPGIALSGFGMEEDIKRSREAGFSEHLIKPVNFQALQDAIRRVLEA